MPSFYSVDPYQMFGATSSRLASSGKLKLICWFLRAPGFRLLMACMRPVQGSNLNCKSGSNKFLFYEISIDTLATFLTAAAANHTHKDNKRHNNNYSFVVNLTLYRHVASIMTYTRCTSNMCHACLLLLPVS